VIYFTEHTAFFLLTRRCAAK